MSVSGLPFGRIGILAGLQAGPDLALTATDQVHEFLRRRHIAAKFAALLRHRATRAHRMLWGFSSGLSLGFSLALSLQGRIDPLSGTITPRQTVNHRPAGFTGRGCTANIVVATTHDGYPLLRKGSQRTSTRKVARRSTESAGPRLRFIRSASERGRSRPLDGGQSGPNGQLAVFSLILSSEGVAAEFIELFRPMFRPTEPTKQFSCAMKPFSVFGADVRKQPMAIR
jgi:hypothetical protein